MLAATCNCTTASLITSLTMKRKCIIPGLSGGWHKGDRVERVGVSSQYVSEQKPVDMPFKPPRGLQECVSIKEVEIVVLPYQLVLQIICLETRPLSTVPIETIIYKVHSFYKICLCSSELLKHCF